MTISFNCQEQNNITIIKCGSEADDIKTSAQYIEILETGTNRIFEFSLRYDKVHRGFPFQPESIHFQ